MKIKITEQQYRVLRGEENLTDEEIKRKREKVKKYIKQLVDVILKKDIQFDFNKQRMKLPLEWGRTSKGYDDLDIHFFGYRNRGMGWLKPETLFPQYVKNKYGVPDEIIEKLYNMLVNKIWSFTKHSFNNKTYNITPDNYKYNNEYVSNTPY